MKGAGRNDHTNEARGRRRRKKQLVERASSLSSTKKRRRRVPICVSAALIVAVATTMTAAAAGRRRLPSFLSHSVIVGRCPTAKPVFHRRCLPFPSSAPQHQRPSAALTTYTFAASSLLRPFSTGGTADAPLSSLSSLAAVDGARPPDFTVVDDLGSNDEEFDGDEGRGAASSASDLTVEPSVGAPIGDYDHKDDDGRRSIGRERASRRTAVGPAAKKKAATTVGTWSSSWMDKNARFDSDQRSSDDNDDGGGGEYDGARRRRRDSSSAWNEGRRRTRDAEGEGRGRRRDSGGGSSTFRDNFRGTRVFVQGLSDQTTWQELKDHFRIAGEVVFASISIDSRTGVSKGCGVVQFETTDEAKNAIKIMREHPLDGETLYVREDFQEKRESDYTGRRVGGGGGLRGDRMVLTWRCANEDNADALSDEQREAVINLIKARDAARRRKNYEASDSMREELKVKHGVHLDDRLKLWWNEPEGGGVPGLVSDIKGDGRWGKQKEWRQIPTTPENDACVNPDLVNALLSQRDVARKEKDFYTADTLLEEARCSPDGDLMLRIHDESRTWRIWTADKPPKAVEHATPVSATEKCIELVSTHDPDKVKDVKAMLKKFPGREWNILKKLKQRYNMK